MITPTAQEKTRMEMLTTGASYKQGGQITSPAAVHELTSTPQMLEKRTANTFKLTQALAQTVIVPLDVAAPGIDLKLKATSIIVKTNKTDDSGADLTKRQQLNKR